MPHAAFAGDHAKSLGTVLHEIARRGHPIDALVDLFGPRIIFVGPRDSACAAPTALSWHCGSTLPEIDASVSTRDVSCHDATSARESFSDRRQPSVREMEDIAWVLRTDARRNEIGFVRASKLRERERHVIED